MRGEHSDSTYRIDVSNLNSFAKDVKRCRSKPRSDGAGILPGQMFRPEAIRGVTVTQPGTVDYRLARQALVSEFRKKRLAQHEVCDAHPELVRAARECGEPTSIGCPICEAANVVLVSYVFGPRLPAFGRCITSKDELTKLSRRADDLACYVVEVCPECSWNHLARAFPLGRGRRS
ncbi:MAG: hypothetical protein QOI95_3391 [Acidimicrobiaceae bacterium]